MAGRPETIASLDEISGRYAAILCDVWGVLHNGVRHFEPAARRLAAARERGVAVVLITNSPRPHEGVEAQFATLGVPDGAWDRVVTSGDVTRELVSAGPRKVFHLGPDRDLSLYDGLDIDLVEEFEANSVVCTGLFDDETETPDDYAEMLAPPAREEPALHLRQSRHRGRARRPDDLVRGRAGARLRAARRPHADRRQAARADL